MLQKEYLSLASSDLSLFNSWCQYRLQKSCVPVDVNGLFTAQYLQSSNINSNTQIYSYVHIPFDWTYPLCNPMWPSPSSKRAPPKPHPSLRCVIYLLLLHWDVWPSLSWMMHARSLTLIRPFSHSLEGGEGSSALTLTVMMWRWCAQSRPRCGTYWGAKWKLEISKCTLRMDFSLNQETWDLHIYRSLIFSMREKE